MPPKKNPDGNPTRNAVKLFSLLLFSGRAYPLKRLAEILECSRQTVLRLVEQIEMSGGSIHKWTENGQSYYQIQSIGTRPKVVLSDQDVEQLVLCREWMQHLLPEGIRQNLERATEKTTVLLENYAHRAEVLEPIGQSSVKGRIDYTGFEKILERLMDSIRTRQVLEVGYLAPHRLEPKKHVFVPMRVIAFHEALYVRGWKVTDRGVPEVTQEITLAIHRLQCLQPTRRHLSPDAMKDLPPLAENGYLGMSRQSKPFDVCARFYSGGAQYVRERQWSKEHKLEEADGGCVRLTFVAQSELEVVKWILGFGADAQLLAPEHLRQRVQDELRSALRYYG